jgi:hypothetical protein
VTLSQDHCKAQNGLLPSEAAMPERAMMREPRKGRTTGTLGRSRLSPTPPSRVCRTFAPSSPGRIMRTSYAAATICGSVLARSRLQDVYRNRDTSTSPGSGSAHRRRFVESGPGTRTLFFPQSCESRGPGYDPGSRSGCRVIPSFLISPSPLLPERPTSLVCRA